MNKKTFTLGIFGGGQLGKFLVQSAKKLNIRTFVFTDSIDSPAIYHSDDFIISNYKNKKKLDFFVKNIDLATFEFENIPFQTLDYVETKITVSPKPSIIRILQDRLKEKNFLNSIGIKTTKFYYLKKINKRKINNSIFPAFVKTTRLGYDGKGQIFFKDKKNFLKYSFKNNEYIIEKLVNFKKEISIVISRNKSKTVAFDAFENLHKHQILQKSKIPANISRKLNNEAREISKKIIDKLNYIGTMCVEFFVTKENKLLVNEIAPRVHNSGHLTLNAYNISQFENHIRAVCNLKLKKPKRIYKATMYNILGFDIEKYRSKNIARNEFFYDYGKKEIKDKRKMGHITKII
ncbi:MAG: 5-(carboxyamino)imidazole ribonucleotide synthase [Candidatus Fonsibacter sp.]